MRDTVTAGTRFCMALQPRQEFHPSAAIPFQPCQIICLEHQTTRLFAEVVQIVEHRQICWARPLCLVTIAVEGPDVQWDAPSQVYDLRSASDLLLPIRLFRVALDEEVVPLLGQLYQDTLGEKITASGRQQMHQLVQDAWQAATD